MIALHDLVQFLVQLRVESGFRDDEPPLAVEGDEARQRRALSLHIRQFHRFVGVAKFDDLHVAFLITAALERRAHANRHGCGGGETQDVHCVHFVSQLLTVSCHCTLFCGLSTQWFSSGKVRNSLGMPRRCNAVNAAMP